MRASRVIGSAALGVALTACARAPYVPPAPPAYTAFGPPRPVTIVGYDDDAMEPFLSRDGHWLFFNNSNSPKVDTNLQLAERIDDSTFRYRGALAGANSGALDAVASMTADSEFWFVSTRSYAQSLSTIYRGRFANGRISGVGIVEGISRHERGRVNFDAEISADGRTLYFVDGRFAGGPIPREADLAIARRDGSGFRAPPAGTDSTFVHVNTPGLEYAPCVSPDGLELFFTRIERGGTGIYHAVRPRVDVPFDSVTRIAGLDGLVEAATLSPDGRTIYFHQRVHERFVIERVVRNRD